MQDVAGHDDVAALVGEFAEQRDGLGAHQGIEAIERLVEHQHARIVRDGLRQLDPLPHALAIPGDLAMRGVAQVHAAEATLGSLAVVMRMPERRR